MFVFCLCIVENCKRGDMIANTDSVVLPGSNITLSCRLKQGEQCKEIIFKNSEMVLAYGRHTFSCKCKSNGKIICGIDIYVGSKEKPFPIFILILPSQDIRCDCC